MNFTKIILTVLYIFTVVSLVFLLVYGGGYYAKPLVDRPHQALHASLKPGGFGGHGLGIIGSVMLLLLLPYLVRKYFRFAQKWGNIGAWLDVHIWFGITGPILVTFHTAFKFGGIVSISFWSMVAVAASGVFGRYIYLQIPRRISGEELTPEELQASDTALKEQIKNLPAMAEPLLERIQSITKFADKAAAGQSSGIRYWVTDSLRLHSQLRNLRRELRAKTKLNRYIIAELLRAVKERRLFERRMAFLKAARSLLHHWHMVHRPFAIVMFLIMAVHVMVTTLLGYTWIF